jgi:leucyl-tRNA synthetase
MDQVRHKTIKAVTDDVERFHFNTAIARLMEFCNALKKYQTSPDRNNAFERTLVEDFTKMIGIFAPHYGEEIWEALGNEYSLFNQDWPKYDESKTVVSTKEIVIQISGKVRGKIMITDDMSEDEIKQMALECPNVKNFTEGKDIKKIIYVKGKLVSIVV